MMQASILTLVKGGLVGLVVMLHFFIFSFTRLRKHFFRNLIVLYSLLLILFAFQVTVSGELRYGTPRYLYQKGYAEASGSRAKLIWIPGLKEVIRGGGIGLGVGTYTYATLAPHAHSIYLSMLFDFGVAGVIVLMIIFWIVLKNYLRMRRFQETYLQTMFIAFSGGLVSIGVHGLVDFEYNSPVLWLFLGLYTATFLLAQRELSALKKAEPGRNAEQAGDQAEAQT